MEFDASIDSKEQFWEELDDVVSTPCHSHERIDDTLRTWLSLTTEYREKYISSEHDLASCSLKLLESPLFSKHTEYVRRQIVYALLQEDDPPSIHLIAAFLLFDARHSEQTYEMMNAVGAFQRLVELIRGGVDDEYGLLRVLLDLMYQMSRVQRLSWDDLTSVDDAFILQLFQIIEGLSGDVNDPYHYAVIRVLLVLNEQYMLSAHDPASSPTSPPVTNRIIKTLSAHGSEYKTFGENMILLLNREAEVSLQLLILKALYLLFTTPQTQEYFYTNDLFVLIDILLRNLLDLPPSAQQLRHTYLRVLHPLLAYTQVRHPPHYKRDELRRTLFILADVGHSHFELPDETTIRLVGRCIAVDWLQDADHEKPGAEPGAEGDASLPTIAEPQGTSSRVDAGHVVVASKGLGLALPEAALSTLSVAEMAAQSEKPGVLTPSLEKEANMLIAPAVDHAPRNNGGAVPVEGAEPTSPFSGGDEE